MSAIWPFKRRPWWRKKRPTGESWTAYVFPTEEEARAHLRSPVELPLSSDEDEEESDTEDNDEGGRLDLAGGFKRLPVSAVEERRRSAERAGREARRMLKDLHIRFKGTAPPKVSPSLYRR